MPSPRLAVAFACVVAAACSSGDAPTNAERFCGEAAAQRDLIVDPPLGTEAELVATLDFYRAMGDLAPLGVATEWEQLVVALETASTVVPGDAESEQLMAATAYATEPAAAAVAAWLSENCGVDIPITTIVPQGRAPAITTTTVPTETTAAPDG